MRLEEKGLDLNHPVKLSDKESKTQTEHERPLEKNPGKTKSLNDEHRRRRRILH